MNLVAKVKNKLKRKRATENHPEAAIVGGKLRKLKFPPLQSRRGLIFIMLFALTGAAVLYLIFAAGENNSDATVIFNNTNSHRTANGRGSLKQSQCLTNAAREWSQHMATNLVGQPGQLHHSSGYAGSLGNVHPGDPGLEGLVFKHCPRPGATAQLKYGAENVGRGGSAESVFGGWVASPSHNKALLEPDANLIGIGSYRDDSGMLWAIQLIYGCYSCGSAWDGAASPATGNTTTVSSPASSATMKTDRTGYWTVTKDGIVKNFGAGKFGDLTGKGVTNIIGMASSASGNGYWLLGEDGGIFAFGDAPFYGSMGGQRLNAPIVAMAAHPGGKGYWFVGADGGIFGFGDAKFLGSMGGQKLNQPIVTMAATPSGNGYWLVAKDGGIFAYGDAAFYGSTGAIALNQPIVAMAPTTNGQGYWLIAKDGGVFSFGNARFFGSTGDRPISSPVIGMFANSDNAGYYILFADGTALPFGSAEKVHSEVLQITPPPPLPTFKTSMSYTSAWPKRRSPTGVTGSWTSAWPKRPDPTYIQMNWYTAWDGGTLPGNCVHIYEYSAPWEYTWRDNQLCSNLDLGFSYTSAWPAGQPIPGNCVNITEPSAPPEHTWGDNVLCTNTVDIGMTWSYDGNRADHDTDCVSLNESSDPYPWEDNFLCWNKYWPRPVYDPLPAGCTFINEPASPWEYTWDDNVFCISPDSVGLSYTSAWPAGQPVPGNCVNIIEPGEPAQYTWHDNVLCTTNVDIGLKWSYTGNLADENTTCVNFYEAADPYYWGDNFLCWNTYWPGYTFDPLPAGCLHINEGVEPWQYTWEDNVLCASPDIGLALNNAWPANQAIPYNCVRLDEPTDPHTWNDNVLCANQYIGMHWSASGSLDNETNDCVNIFEYSDPADWGNNFLCWYVPPDTPPPSAGQSDLIVTDLTWVPASPATGNQVTFSATVKNQGTGPTPDGQYVGIAFFVDGNAVGWTGTAGVVQPGATVNFTSNNGGPNNNGTWTAVGGAHSVEAFVDDPNRFPEADDNNNKLTKTLAVGQPDLIVTDLTWIPASPATGNQVSFTATIKNQGTVATPSGVIHGVNFMVGSTLVGWNAGSDASLAPGATRTLTSSAGGPNGNGTWTAASGSHNVQAFVDDVNRMVESDENNNKLIKTLTIAAPNTPPTAPTSLRTTSVTHNSVALAWNASTDDKGVASYRIYRSGTLIGTSTQLSYTDAAGLSASTNYNYQITAVDADGAVSAGSNIISVTTAPPPDTSPPTTPTNFNATAASSTQVNLSWTASTDNIGVSKYYVYRAIGTGTASVIGQPAGTTFTDSNATANTTYTYSVKAADAAGNLSGAATKTVTTPQAPDTTAPAAPANLTGTAASSTQVNLTWTASADSGGSGLSGYEVWRNNSKIATIGLVTSYGDANGLAASSTYSYYVKARDGAGNVSANSNVVSVTTPPPAAPLTTTQAPQGNWVDTYGRDGHVLFAWNEGHTDLASLPAGITMTLNGAERWQWSMNSTATQALQSPDKSIRRATAIYSPSQFSAKLTFANAYSGNLHLYAVDWDNGNRRQTYTITDASGSRSLSLTSSFVEGAWVHAPISVPAGGSVTVSLANNSTVTNMNAVLAGLFLGDGTTTTPPPTGTTGLSGTYFDNMDFTSQKLTRVDPKIDFSWGEGSPDASVGVDTFSARWTGQVKAEKSETYTFYTYSDDGVRLWVNNQLIVDNWTDHAPTENSGSIALTAGQSYDIKLEFYENAIGAVMQLSWSSPSTPKVIIPASQLVPTSSTTPTDTTPPAAPTNLRSTAVAYNKVDLAWNASTSTDTTKYQVLRNNIAIGTVNAPGTTFSDATVVASTAYTYSVKAFDAANNASTASNQISVNVPAAPDTTPPDTPTGFTATASAYNKVDLAWNPSAAADTTKYYVYRGTSIIATVNHPTTTYSDTTVTASTQYSYSIRAVDGANNTSTSTNVITVTTPAAPTTGTGSDTTPPSAPTSLSYSIVNSNQVNLRWTAATDNVGVARYDIYRKSGTFGSFTRVGSSTTLTFGDVTVNPNTAYSYYVKAVDAAGNAGPASNTVSFAATNKK